MPSVGETLREARKKKGIPEDIAAKALKIKSERIRALEEDRYDEFPAHVYARSFVRQYADYLGLDTGPVVESFMVQNPPSEQKPIFGIVDEQQRPGTVQRHVLDQGTNLFLSTTGKIILTATVVVILTIIGLFTWVIRTPAWTPQKLPTQSLPPAVQPTPQSTSLLDSQTNSFNSSSLSTNQWETPPSIAPLPAPALSLSTNIPNTTTQPHRPEKPK